MAKKSHLSEAGLQEIINLRACLNTGLSDVLKKAFPLTVSAVRPLISQFQLQGINEHWMAGFVSAEGCFLVRLTKTPNRTRVQLAFKVTQHSRDKLLLKSFVDFFKCGKYYYDKGESGYFLCVNFKDLHENIIPFFLKYKIVGVKLLDFED